MILKKQVYVYLSLIFLSAFKRLHNFSFLASNGKKERKDSDSGRESLKRGPKRPTRQSMDSTSKASSSPRDTPPPKRRRI